MIKLSEMIVFYIYPPKKNYEQIGKNISPMKVYQRANREEMMVSDRICQVDMIAYFRGKWHIKLKEKSISKNSNPYGSSTQSFCRKIIEITKFMGYTPIITKRTPY